MSGDCKTFTTSAFSFSMIGFGVAAGAMSPSQIRPSYPATPDSATVGTSGVTVERFLPVVAIALSLPACT